MCGAEALCERRHYVALRPSCNAVLHSGLRPHNTLLLLHTTRVNTGWEAARAMDLSHRSDEEGEGRRPPLPQDR